MADMEFHKERFLKPLREMGVEVRPGARHAPWMNLVERHHSILKNIGAKNEIRNLCKCADIANKIPFSDIPAQIRKMKWSPEELFRNNNINAIKQINEFREKKSYVRNLRQTEARQNNVNRCLRNIEVKDVVKFNVEGENKIETIVWKNNKIVIAKCIGPGREYSLHVSEVMKLSVTENFVRNLTQVYGKGYFFNQQIKLYIL